MPSFLMPVNLNKNELQNAVVQNLASAPGSPVKGQLYFDTVGNILYCWNGTSWIAAQSGSPSFGTVGASAVGDTIAAGSSGNAARADHVHGREAFAAVSAQTSFGASSSNGSATTIPHSDHVHGTPTHDAAAHSAISLSSLAGPTADLAIGSHKLTGLTDPGSAQDAATKAYVDNARAGLSLKDPVRVATTANGAMATAYANSQSVDGVTLATGDRILVKNQTTGSENGIYTVNASGAPTRATDADGSGEILDGTAVWVASGTANGDQRWVMTTLGGSAPWIPGTNATTWTLDFAATSVTAGAGLTGSGQVLAVGAGTGISVAADSVTVDRSTNGAIVPFKYSTNVGDGTSTSITVTHNLGTTDVHVAVFAVGSPFAEVEPDVQHTTTNTVTLIFAVAPTSAQYRCVVIG